MRPLTSVLIRLKDFVVSSPLQISREALQDFRHTLRLWCNYPWHAGLAITALALGIGANTGVFSIVNALLLRSLPFREPDRLVLLHQFIPPHDSAKEFHEWRQHSAYLADAALFEEFDVNLGSMRVGSRVHIAQTSWNFFSVLGLQPALGSGFSADEDVDGTGWGLPGPNAAAVIRKFWAPRSPSMESPLPLLALRRPDSITRARLFSGSRPHSVPATMAGEPWRG